MPKSARPSIANRQATLTDPAGAQAPRHDPRLIPVLVAVAYVACLIAQWGLTSLLLDRDVITEADAGPLLGPAMAVSASIVVALALWGLRRRGHPASTAIGTTAVAYLVMLVVGAVGYWFAHPDPVQLLLFPAAYALSPFIIGAAVLGGIAVVFTWVVTFRDRRI